MKALINKIITQKIPCYFISPHPDDAVFSCGGLISFLADKTQTRVISVFTGGSLPPYTLSARKHICQSGSSDAIQLSARRIAEDQKAIQTLGSTMINLSYPDALFRVRNNQGSLQKYLGGIIPEIVHLYPTYRWHILNSHLHPQDKQIISQISGQLKKLVPSGAIVFCPLAVGNHVDHLVVRESCLSLRRETVFWMDFPYNLSSKPDKGFISRHRLSPAFFTAIGASKIKASEIYYSQYRLTVNKPDTLVLPEQYYLPTLEK
jgi:LmbE family N-acetylglucosaminyl deacetylase